VALAFPPWFGAGMAVRLGLERLGRAIKWRITARIAPATS
jgi:hypothetical protein